VPDHLLADTTLTGEPVEFLHQVDRFVRAGVDRPVLRLLGQFSAAQCVEMLGNLASAGKVACSG
jgi:hypothetical protein